MKNLKVKCPSYVWNKEVACTVSEYAEILAEENSLMNNAMGMTEKGCFTKSNVSGAPALDELGRIVSVSYRIYARGDRNVPTINLVNVIDDQDLQ